MQDREANESAVATRGVEEATWERKDMMRATYPFLFRDEGTQFSRLVIKWLVCMHVVVFGCIMHVVVRGAICI